MRSQRDILVEELFQLVVDLEPCEREDFFARHCADDAWVRAELEEFLAHDSEGTRDYLTSPVLTDVPPQRPRVPVDPARPLTRVGPYRLLDKLGEGGMGVVYLAEQEQPVERRVALKIVKPGMDTPRVLLRFETERQSLAQLEHPGIARLYDAGTLENGRPFFVMEYIPGESIAVWCDTQRLDVDGRLGLFVQVCDAVQHAHRRGIVHRDLKPHNVLVTRTGDRVQPKIIDFGVARIASDARRDNTTSEPDVAGTRMSMSPEQADPAQDMVDTRTDVYSLGCLLYELLCGVAPFTAEDFQDRPVLEVLRGGVATLPSQRLTSIEAANVATFRATTSAKLARRLAGDLDAIVALAMAPDPEQRYGTVAELAADVRRHQQHRLVLARQAPLAERVVKFARRNRTTVALAGMLVLMVLVGVGMVLNRAAQDREQRRVALEVTHFLAQALTPDYDTLGPSGSAARRSTLQRIQALLQEGVLSGQQRAEIQVRHALGVGYHRLGELDEAAAELRQALQLLMGTEAPTPDLRFPIESALAHVYLDSDERDTMDLLIVSEFSLVRAVSERNPALGLGLSEVMAVISSSSWPSLDTTLDELLRTAQLELYPDDPSWRLVASLLAAEAVWASWVGQHGAALELAEAALTIRRRELPATDLDLARSLEQVGNLMVRTGAPSEASAPLEQALEVLTRRLGERHWLVARVRSVLGECLLLQGRPDLAEEQLRFGLERLEERRGPFNQDTAEARRRMLQLVERTDPEGARVLRDQLAESLAFSSNPALHWGAYRDAFGTDRRAIVEAADVLDEHLRDRRAGLAETPARLENALTEVEVALDGLAVDDPRRVLLARALREWGIQNPGLAIELRERMLLDAAGVLEGHAELLSYDLGDVLSHLGVLALRRGDVAAARARSSRASLLLEASAGAFAMAYQLAQRTLAVCEARSGDTDQGLQRARRSLETCGLWFGESSALSVRARETLIAIQLDAGRVEEAAATLAPPLATILERGRPGEGCLDLAWLVLREERFPTSLHRSATDVVRLCEDAGWEDPLMSLGVAAAAWRSGDAAAVRDQLEGALLADRVSARHAGACHALRVLAGVALADAELVESARVALASVPPSADMFGGFDGALRREAADAVR